MKYLRLLALVCLMVFASASQAQLPEILSSLNRGDSLCVVTKSGVYNYGTFQAKTDSSIFVFVEKQSVATIFLVNRIAQILVFNASPAPLNEKNVPQSQRNANRQANARNTNQVNAASFAAKLAAAEKAKENSAIFSRYFFAPSAIKHKKSVFVYENSYGFINSLSYSPTDFMSVTGGAELISTLIGSPIVMLSPHVGFPLGDQLYLGGGYFYGAMVDRNSSLVNAIYGTVTWGNNNKNVSVNLGKGINTGSSYTLNISGYLKLNKNIALISENWFFEDNEILGADIPLIGFGGRLFGEKVNFDFALVSLVFPYVGFSCKF